MNLSSAARQAGLTTVVRQRDRCRYRKLSSVNALQSMQQILVVQAFQARHK